MKNHNVKRTWVRHQLKEVGNMLLIVCAISVGVTLLLAVCSAVVATYFGELKSAMVSYVTAAVCYVGFLTLRDWCRMPISWTTVQRRKLAHERAMFYDRLPNPVGCSLLGKHLVFEWGDGEQLESHLSDTPRGKVWDVDVKDIPWDEFDIAIKVV